MAAGRKFGSSVRQSTNEIEGQSRGSVSLVDVILPFPLKTLPGRSLPRSMSGNAS